MSQREPDDTTKPDDAPTRESGSYYYDDATGYETYDPRADEEGGESEDDDEPGGPRARAREPHAARVAPDEPPRLWAHASAGALARAPLAACAVLYVAARLWRLTRYSLDGDEVFSLLLARGGWRALFEGAAQDFVHPPLFYLILKLWIAAGGESLAWLRLLPTLLSLAALAPFALLCRELRLRAAEAFAALLFLSVNGFLIFYSRELRMYSLLFLAGLTSLWLFARFYNAADDAERRRLLPALFAAHLVLVHAHYYGWLQVCAELLFALPAARALARRLASALAALVLCSLPWACVAASALARRRLTLGGQLFWQRLPAPADLAAFFAYFNGPFTFAHSTTVGLLLFSPVVVWALGDGLRRGGESRGWLAVAAFLLTLVFAPVAATVAASYLMPGSVWHPRYLIGCAAPYLLLVALSLGRVRPRAARVALAVALLSWSTASGFYEVRYVNRRLEWDGFARSLHERETARGPVRIYLLDYGPPLPLAFYLAEIGDARFETRVIKEDELPSLDEQHFWVIYDEARLTGVTPPQQALRERGYEVGEMVATGPAGQRRLLFPASRPEAARPDERR